MHKHRMKGTSTAAAAVALLVIAAAAGIGYFAWQKNAELQRTKRELATTQAGLAKAAAELRAAQAAIDAMSKEIAEQKSTAELLRAERDSAKNLLAAEAARGERLRAELALAQQQLAFMRSRQAPAATITLPSVVRAKPMAIQAIRAPGPQSAGSPAQAAPTPAQGFSRQP